MRIYIIHSPKTEENYFERIRAIEERLIEEGHHIVNPLPEGIEERNPEFDNVDFFRMYAPKINICDVAFAMLGWGKSNICNTEMAEAMMQRKIIAFEQEAS